LNVRIEYLDIKFTVQNGSGYTAVLLKKNNSEDETFL
jgi:hypothetical protein